MKRTDFYESPPTGDILGDRPIKDFVDDMQRLVALDFDGVVHRFSRGWRGERSIYDPPVEGIGRAMGRLVADGYRICIVSSRARTEAGKAAIAHWLHKEGFDIYVDMITSEKMPALCYVDDRAITFTGDAEAMYSAVKNMRSWCDREDA